MDNEMISNPEGIFIQFTIARHQSQSPIWAGLYAQRLIRLTPSSHAEITVMDQQRNMLRVDCAVRAGVRTGLTADTQHVVPDQQ
jgi:hypothetical protein